MNIYDEIYAILIKRGWTVAVPPRMNSLGEIRDLVHPETDEKMTWLEAIEAESFREI